MRRFNRPALTGLVVFAGALALGLFVGGPAICRNPALATFFDVVPGCPGGMGNSFTALLYFSSVALALIAGMLVNGVGRGDVVPATEIAAAVAEAPAGDAAPLTPEAVVAEAESVAVPSEANLEPKPLAETPAPAPVMSIDDETEFLKKVWELDKKDTSEAVPLAERVVDENALAAIQRGADPKMHLSKLAQIVLQQDPELKSTVMRAVIVHVALRLKELGVEVETGDASAEANAPAA